MPLVHELKFVAINQLSGGHYRGAVLVNGEWHYYDGLWERNSKGRAGTEKVHREAIHSK